MALPPFTMVMEDDGAPEKPLPPPPVDPALAEGAIARIRKQVQGNGLKPSSVELRAINGFVHGFYGTTSVHLAPSVQEAKRSGRFTDGQIIQPQQINEAVQDFVSRVASDRGVLGLVHETVLARPDQGFGVSGDAIPLPQVTRTFVAHEPCGKCRGAGGTPCHNCLGQMRITCYRCHGQGGVACITCQGRGQILTPQGPVVCHACAGRGLSVCPVCQSQRMITCPECQGHGKKICEGCGGQGWTTKSWAVTLTAQTTFRLRTKGLPPALVTLIDRVGGAKLATDGHARITPILGRDAEMLAPEADISQGASLWFLYRAEMPFAELDIAMGKGSIRPKLAGFKARLLEVPEFMDALLKPGLEILSEAAAGGAASTQKILECARWRALGDTLRSLVRGNSKRALKSLMETYTLGLSENTAKRIVKDANTALSRLSLWPRMVAMGGALGVSLVLLAAYYMYGGRDAVSGAVLPEGTTGGLAYVFDLIFAVLLAAAGTHAIRMAAGKASKNVLEGLGVVSGGQMPLPKPGAPGLWLCIGIAAMALGFSVLNGLFG
ncbi:MAG: hypothetical protein KGQ41_04635 [Alphaproteobacteria bacterium]|nr:hypothetical protein [Alphaproteobacteria bacterium]